MPVAEMVKTFNCGIGAVVVVAHDDQQSVEDMLQSTGENPQIIGSVIPHTEGQ